MKPNLIRNSEVGARRYDKHRFSEESKGMKAARLLTVVVLLGVAAAQENAPAPASPIQTTQTQPPQTQVPATPATPSAATPGAAPLRVMTGKSLLIKTQEKLKRVSVTDPTV